MRQTNQEHLRGPATRYSRNSASSFGNRVCCYYLQSRCAIDEPWTLEESPYSLLTKLGRFILESILLLLAVFLGQEFIHYKFTQRLFLFLNTYDFNSVTDKLILKFKAIMTRLLVLYTQDVILSFKFISLTFDPTFMFFTIVVKYSFYQNRTKRFLMRQNKTDCTFSKESFSSSHELYKNKQVTCVLPVGFFQLPRVYSWF